MVYNCHYPILHTFYATAADIVAYDIYIGNTIVYSGKVIPFDVTSNTCQIDISRVCRKYLEPFYENVSFSGNINTLVPTNGNIATLNVFRVASSYNDTGASDDVSYPVCYNYNTDYILTGNDVANINNPILLEADPRQYLFVGGYAYTGSTRYGWSKNGGVVTWSNSLGTTYQLLGIKLNGASINANEDDIISLSQENTAQYDYKIIKPCRSKFALYYVNKLGGLDSLVCSGRYIESWSPNRIDVRIYDNRQSRQDFQQKRIFQDIAKRYELNTRWIDEEKAILIDELIYSPKCFIHDLDKDTITSCLVTDTSYSATRFKLNDSPAQYTINVEESQLYERE